MSLMPGTVWEETRINWLCQYTALRQPIRIHRMNTSWSNYQCHILCSHRRSEMPSHHISSELFFQAGRKSTLTIKQLAWYICYLYIYCNVPILVPLVLLITWIRAKTMRIITAANKNGPRKLKSWPRFAAQNVYIVRLTTTTDVRITDSNIISPAKS